MNEPCDRDPVDALADEFIQRHRHGESLSIEDFALAYPAYASEIRDLFPVLLQIEGLKHRGPFEAGEQATIGSAPIRQLGDFRIIREIGRGGMGVVFEAEQQSLGRRVALKVIAGSSAGSANGVRRFRREAGAAARLHHEHRSGLRGRPRERLSLLRDADHRRRGPRRRLERAGRQAAAGRGGDRVRLGGFDRRFAILAAAIEVAAAAPATARPPCPAGRQLRAAKADRQPGRTRSILPPPPRPLGQPARPRAALGARAH